ncbi:MAG: FG-GAP-like repeat-containing protein [Fimbriimonadaceae bacterium]
MSTFSRSISISASILIICSIGASQVRFGVWNVTTYTGNSPVRDAAFQTSVFGTFQTRTFRPDMVVIQELTSQSAQNNFRSMLNSASGSPADYETNPFLSSPNFNSGVFFRQPFFVLVDQKAIPDTPRNIYRHDFALAGYGPNAPRFTVYHSHMKAGSSGNDQQIRLDTAIKIRSDAETLPNGTPFIVCGDFNVQSSAQAFYQHLTGSLPNNSGRVFDPINSPGTWNNNPTFRFIHTQDPTGPMDDRLDQILLSEHWLEPRGFQYVGNPALAYSTSTWNDPNHSYRAWGNDGTSYNTALTVANNQMVGATIAQALIDSVGDELTGGHLPVFLDFRVPALPGVTLQNIDFGDVEQNSSQSRPFGVFNAVDSNIWSNSAVQTLVYTMGATAGFTVPGGQFTRTLAQAPNIHNVTLDTSTTGQKTGSITIADPHAGLTVINLSANVLPSAPPVNNGIIWRNDPANGYAFWSLNGPTVLGTAALFNPAQGEIQAAADLNGDGKTELIWKSPNGDAFVSFMTGEQITNTQLIGNLGGFDIAVTGDFDGSGRQDLFLYNPTTQEARIWMMNGAAVVAVQNFGVVGAWEPRFARDLNGNGRADIVWVQSNSIAIWLMNGTAVSSTASYVAGTGWNLKEVRDLNGNGRSDLIWENNSTSSIAFWLMNGITPTTFSSISGLGDWRIAGMGDFNGSGRSDILWTNQSTGGIAIWLMNGTAIQQSAVVGNAPGWQVRLVNRFDATGRDSIIWQSTAGEVALWQLSGVTVTGTTVFGNVNPWVATFHKRS